MEGRAEEVVLVATGRRERRRPPACRRHTAKSNNGGVLQRRRRRRLVETCQMRLLQGVRRGGVGHSGRRVEPRSSGGARNLLLGMPNKKKFEANTYNGHNKSMNITKVRVLNMDN